MLKPDGIKNIIFDLGGVIINLDLNLTIEKFRALGLSDVETHFTQLNQSGLFDKLDKGRISPGAFLSQLNEMFPVPPGEGALTDAWLSMLLDFPPEHAELLNRLKLKYNTFLLSNTNEIHLEYFFKRLNEQFGVDDMTAFVHKVYYSCRIDMRKPDPEIFEYVLKDNNLHPEETLFIDDSPQHVEGARKTGIIAHHLVEPEGILGLLRGF